MFSGDDRPTGQVAGSSNSKREDTMDVGKRTLGWWRTVASLPV
jgi:hypothetical protein